MAGAGIILAVKTDDKKYKYVCLLKKNGKLDLPKGKIEKKESIIDCAFREAFEEINLLREDVILITDCGVYTPILGKSIYLFLCVIDESVFKTLKIKRNDKTGKLEHEKILLLSEKSAEKDLLYYLRGSIIWANNILKKRNV